jgi:hypothetical protein
MLPQDEALDVLGEFLETYGEAEVNKINIKTIKELGSIVLKKMFLFMVKNFSDKFLVVLWVHYLH